MKPHYRALSEWEGVDEIKIRQVPRFKTSGLSGDEWRVSAKIEFYRKGELVYERSVSRMRDAAKFLPWFLEVEIVEGDGCTFKRGLFGHFPEECKHSIQATIHGDRCSLCGKVFP